MSGRSQQPVAVAAVGRCHVLFLGPPRFFGDKLGSLPAPLEITEVADGFQVVHPRNGEPSLFKFRDPPGFFGRGRRGLCAFTHTAGPVGNTDVMTFASNSTFGRVGAIEAFTDTGFTRLLSPECECFRHIPHIFRCSQVKYKGGVPTETSYLLHRERAVGITAQETLGLFRSSAVWVGEYVRLYQD